ncbi:ribosomal maturation YjgA family protein [Parvularcula lutaonensis]|uniref:DUF2809 domain-containing protein n=1 Tax=Parvularcula lutaonensis TaxID=491923 RepID=A0ABV7MEZ0_9PROT|nr:DUF2809 domain-containing protein [Parvularcula lutaonensis]GGY51759.1 hypothetical protein GCM10007148_20860 [Parvularcula lutaonensis]
MRLLYLLVVGILSVILAAIAVFGEGLVRTHGGDLLVVIWLYALIRLVTMMPKALAAVLTLIVAFGIEFGQVIDLAGQLGLGEGRGARLALGNTYDPLDLVAYTLGVGLAFILDRALSSAR